MKYAVPLLLAVLILGACSTVPTEKDGFSFVELINNGEWQELSDMTGSPFLLDTEMIMRPADTREFWKILAEGGFSLGEAEFAVLDDPADSSRYGSGLEIEQFFAKYVPEDAVTFVVDGGPGKFFLTVGKDDKRKNRIFAFTGPVE